MASDRVDLFALPEPGTMAPDKARAAVLMASELSQAINDGVPVGEVCQVMASWLQRLFDLVWGSVALLDDSNRYLEPRPLSDAVEGELDRVPRHSIQGSLMGWVILSQRPLLIEDLDAAVALPEQQGLLRQGLRSIAIVPVTFRDKIIGSLNLGSRTPLALSPTDLPIFELLAHLVALALGRARAEVVKRRSAALALLSEVGRLAQSTLDTDRLLGEVAALIKDTFRASFVAFSVPESGRAGLALRAASYAGASQGPPAGSLRPSLDTVVRQLQRDGRALVEDHPSHRQHPLVGGDNALVLLTLRTAERMRGVLEVGRESSDPFTAEELKLLETVSDRVAGALDTAALFQELERSNKELGTTRDELSTLYEIGRVATSTLDLNRILSPVTKMIGESFGYDFVAIFLTKESELELRAWTEAGAEHTPSASGSMRVDTLKVRLELSEKANAGSLAREVARTGETLVVANSSRNPRAAPIVPASRSAAAIPLKVGSGIVGVLCAESTEVNAFDLEDVRILETLADQLSTAIDNARLYRELLAANERQAQTFRELRAVQDDLMHSTRLAALGEMSGRVAHEVLNPITGILARVQSDLKKMPSSERSGLLLIRRILDRWLEAARSGNLMEVLGAEMEKKGSERFISLMSEIVATGQAQENQMREDLAFIERHSLRIVKIVDSLRGLARQSQSREVGSLVPALREAVELVRDTCERRAIQLVESYPKGLPDVEVDPSEIVQVLSNVLRNAIQAMEGTGAAGGAAGKPGRIHVEVGFAEPNLEVRVRDTGPGVEPDNVRFIFDPDFTTKDRTKGTGLGLSICRRFLRGYGGDIVLEENRPGQGCTFLLTVPRADPDRKASGGSGAP